MMTRAHAILMYNLLKSIISVMSILSILFIIYANPSDAVHTLPPSRPQLFHSNGITTEWPWNEFGQMVLLWFTNPSIAV